MLIQSGLPEKQSKLAIKTCKDDAIAAFKKGEVEQSVIDEYTEKEKGLLPHNTHCLQARVSQRPRLFIADQVF
jgi:hypothetical protein